MIIYFVENWFSADIVQQKAISMQLLFARNDKIAISLSATKIENYLRYSPNSFRMISVNSFGSGMVMAPAGQSRPQVLHSTTQL